jgi:hypothetical protein
MDRPNSPFLGANRETDVREPQRGVACTIF